MQFAAVTRMRPFVGNSCWFNSVEQLRKSTEMLSSSSWTRFTVAMYYFFNRLPLTDLSCWRCILTSVVLIMCHNLVPYLTVFVNVFIVHITIFYSTNETLQIQMIWNIFWQGPGLVRVWFKWNKKYMVMNKTVMCEVYTNELILNCRDS